LTRSERSVMSRSRGKRRKPKRPQPRPQAARPRQASRIAAGAAALAALAVCGWLIWSNFSSGASAHRLEFLRVEVLRTFSHDRRAYTQGLLWHEGKLFESTGQYGHSTVRRLDPQSGRVEQRFELPRRFFGEGLALQGGRLVQLTWHEGTAIGYDLDTLQPSQRMSYSGEGWGLCWDGSRFIMSDGSSLLTFRDADQFKPLGRLQVSFRGRPLEQLNELEFAQGWVYANVWQEDFIVRIDPESGRVTGHIDAAGLLPPSQAQGVDVLNGIAYNPHSDTFYLTGKYWPQMFEVRFVPKASQK